MNIELLKIGCFVMIIGMGFVYIFLLIMIWIVEMATKLIKILNKYFPEAVEEEKYQPKKKSEKNDAEIALAIACAIAERSKQC